jgi:PKD domain-containing protein
VDVVASPDHGRTRTPVDFAVSATDADAAGPLYYSVEYGDGGTASNIIPFDCKAGPGSPESGEWPLTHQYAKAGSETVTVEVSVSCSPVSATVTLTVSPTAG